MALPVPKPGVIVNEPPATSVPIALAPTKFEATGVELVSASPKITVVFLNTKLLLIVLVPAGISVANAVTRSSV